MDAAKSRIAQGLHTLSQHLRSQISPSRELTLHIVANLTSVSFRHCCRRVTAISPSAPRSVSTATRVCVEELLAWATAACSAKVTHPDCAIRGLDHAIQRSECGAAGPNVIFVIYPIANLLRMPQECRASDRGLRQCHVLKARSSCPAAGSPSWRSPRCAPRGAPPCSCHR